MGGRDRDRAGGNCCYEAATNLTCLMTARVPVGGNVVNVCVICDLLLHR